MQPRLDLITLGVPDLAEARRFYVDGLGWQPAMEVEDEIVFIQIGHGLLLGLWDAQELERDIGSQGTPGQGAGITFAHNVESEEAVLGVLGKAAEAGATVLKEGQRADFGGFHGYFADPAGFRWEVAYNPGWSVDPDGTVRMSPVEP